VALGIEQRQARFEAQLGSFERRDDDLRPLDRHAHTLIDVQARRLCHRSGQSNAEVAAPAFEIENRFGHLILPARFNRV
jgi:hypothetical protein